MNELEYEEILKYKKGRIINGHKREKERIQKISDGLIEKLGKLYKQDEQGRLLKILKLDEIEAILYMTHDHPTGAHFGLVATYNKIKEKYYWKGMKQDIENYIKTCDKCQRRGQQGSKGYLHPITVEKPFERIGIDFMGPLPRSRKGNKYILVITDYLTKWTEAKAMREATAEKVVKYLYRDIICRHGCPKIILSDRGSHFNNKMMEGLCGKFEIKHHMSSPYHPQTNGLTERFNRTLSEALAKILEEENQWDEYIEPVLFAYRTNKHSTTRQTPFYMMYGREAILPTDEINQDEHEINDESNILSRIYDIIQLDEKREEVIETIRTAQVKQKEKHDERIKEIIFAVDDKVLLKDAAKEKQWSGKLQPKWKGPYTIHQVIGKGAYKLKDAEGRILKTPYNIKLLKRYFERN